MTEINFWAKIDQKCDSHYILLIIFSKSVIYLKVFDNDEYYNSYTDKSIMNLVISNQILIVITLF